METELDTETDSDDDDDTVNIYEEVLNQENCRHRQPHSRLSTTSSLYSSGVGNYNRNCTVIGSNQVQVTKKHQNVIKIIVLLFYF